MCAMIFYSILFQNSNKILKPTNCVKHKGLLPLEHIYAYDMYIAHYIFQCRKYIPDVIKHLFTLHTSEHYKFL